jgi:hypothetical protein
MRSIALSGKTVSDVPMREDGGSDERGVLDTHAVMHLVSLAQPAEDRNRVLDIRLFDEDWLEASFERRVLLDVLAVFIQRRRADRVQFTRASIGLSILPASIAPSAAPAPTTVCNSSMKRMISPRSPAPL